jgi:hypothetical protein
MGLYDDDKATVTSGDVLDVFYWQTKFAALKLDAALATRQPEYPIRLLTAEVVNGANDVLRDYPAHADVQAWKQKAETIAAKVDPNAPSAGFKTNFAHWSDYGYEAGWRSYHIAKMAVEDGDGALAKSHARESATQLGRAADRMADWPADIQEWVRSARAEMETLAAR